jgi:hypothetical protein
MTTPTASFKTVTIHGEDGFQATFKIRKLPVLKQASVSKMLATTVLPVINGLKVGMAGASGASVQDFLKSAVSFDIGSSVDAVCKALGDMDDEKMEKLLLSLFATTSVIGAGRDEVLLDQSAVISYACNDDLAVTMQLAMEVIGYCLPFGAKVKSLYGLATKAMSSLDEQLQGRPETEPQSETSESSPTT